MIKKRFSKSRLGRFIFGCLFAIISVFSLATLPSNNVYADPEPQSTTEVTTSPCKDSFEGVAWLVCSSTGKVTDAVDWLYKKIEDILIINPVKMEDGEPIYEIWKYARGVTNIVFIILLLVVVYSQITGVGITNYGIKKILPKLIIVAILVNLSFIICSLAVDLSNIIGGGLRGLLLSVENSAIATMQVPESNYYMTMSQIYAGAAEGLALTIAAGVVAFETGAIFMLIPIALGAIVAVVTGLVTIAMRQAVVVLLIMIAPLAIVAYMLPNTEKWFKKWKDLFMRMLVFYPMFSLLFGAASLAGGAIMASSGTDGFGLMLGIAVKIFPLFFSWSLMKMSGTFLGTVNAKLNALAARPLASSRAWADSRREYTNQKNLASGNPYTPSLRLRQYLFNRKVAREEETKEYAEVVKNRGLAYAAMRNYKKDGTPSREGEEAYEMQARNMQYQRAILRHKNNMNKGLGQLEAVKMYSSAAQKARLDELDMANMNEADYLKMETARGAKIDYDNTKGFYDRVTDAVNARMDLDAINAGNNRHQLHGVLGDGNNIARYETMKQIMEGRDIDTSFIAADAAHAFNAQAQIVRGKFKDYFDYTAPTQDVVNLLSQLTKYKDSNSYIDPIIAGLRTLNFRGDTDLVTDQIENVLADRKVALGTYASQSLANFLMFDVKGNDPFLRRFGKYINLETAHMFDEKDPDARRARKDVSLYEYVNGKYAELDENGDVVIGDDGKPKMVDSKRGAAILLKGTSFKDMERTAMKNMRQTIRKYSVDIDEDGNETFNLKKFEDNEEAIWNAIMPNIISDQFSYLSGSEAIMALGNGLFGVDLQKHRFDWEGIFGKEADNLTPEDKKNYIESLSKRVGSFFGGHVPVQIARSKTDILDFMQDFYTLKNAAEDPAMFQEIIKKAPKGVAEKAAYANLYTQMRSDNAEAVKHDFRKAFNKEALEGFSKMYHKGFQGESKGRLAELLPLEDIYREWLAKNPNRRENGDEEEEGGEPVGSDNGSGGDFGGPTNAVDTRGAIQELHRNYSGNNDDVRGFWEGVKSIINNSSENIPGSDVIIDEFESTLSLYSTVGELYAAIISRLFGGGNS